MNSDVEERRRTLFSLVTRGMSPTQASERLAQEYGVKKKTIQVDWSNRDEWLYKIFSLEDEEKTLKEIIAEQKEVKSALWQVHGESNSESTKLGALKKVSDVNKRILEILQSVGEIEEEPDKFEHEVEHKGDISFDNNELKQGLQELKEEFEGMDELSIENEVKGNEDG